METLSCQFAPSNPTLPPWQPVKCVSPPLLKSLKLLMRTSRLPQSGLESLYCSGTPSGREGSTDSSCPERTGICSSICRFRSLDCRVEPGRRGFAHSRDDDTRTSSHSNPMKLAHGCLFPSPHDQ